VAEGLPEDGERWADELLDRLTPVMSALSIVFVLIVIGESMADEDTTLSFALTVAGWLTWLVFAAEFAARMVLAPDTGAFLKRNWWQVLFLILPFLRIFRLVRVFRILRTGRVLSSGIRSSRDTLADRVPRENLRSTVPATSKPTSSAPATTARSLL